MLAAIGPRPSAIPVPADLLWGEAWLAADPADTTKACTGREWDPETNLYYYRARYYDPTIGRFLSEDPIPPAARRMEEQNPPSKPAITGEMSTDSGEPAKPPSPGRAPRPAPGQNVG
jgi:RHS repeat-associated protein